MKILIASDSFKGSMTALEASESINQGVISVCPNAMVKKLPLSDGGEGLVDCLIAATGGKYMKNNVTGPMGKPTIACWGILGDQKTAVIEMASASGLLVDTLERNDPRIATTYGTGELIKAALDAGCSKIILGLGGSATNDGGSGMAQALGAKLLNRNGQELPFGGSSLLYLNKIDISGLDSRLKDVEVQAACDVDNPLIGNKGASHVFGPQKGASSEVVLELDRGLSHYAKIIKQDLNVDIVNMPGAGAAGGLGAGVVAFLNGNLSSGIDLVIESVGLEAQLKTSDLVFTGEGKLDEQTVYGKVPVGVARLAKKHQIPLIAIAGSVCRNNLQLYQEGITACFPIITEPMSLESAMSQGKELLEFTANQIMRLITINDY